MRSYLSCVSVGAIFAARVSLTWHQVYLINIISMEVTVFWAVVAICKGSDLYVEWSRKVEDSCDEHL